jgi:hypothetical protein
MLRRLLTLGLVAPVTFLAAGCSSLTKPDEIRIVAESITPASTPGGADAARAPGAGGVVRAVPAGPGAPLRTLPNMAPGAQPGGG